MYRSLSCIVYAAKMKLLLPLPHAQLLPPLLISGSLSNDDGNGNENVTRKHIFISFVLLRDYFNSLNFYKNGELSRNQIGRSGVEVKKENEKFTVVRSRSPQDLKPATHLAILYADRGEFYRQRKSQAIYATD